MKSGISSLKILTPLLMLVILLIGFQNCAGQLEDEALVMASSSDDSFNFYQLKSYELRSVHCAGCHSGSDAVAEPTDILDEDYLISNNWIVPGQPQASRLYLALHTSMPLNRPPLPDMDIMTIEKWIEYMLEDGEQPGLLSIEDVSPVHFGIVSPGQSKLYELTLKNNGDRAAQRLMGSSLNHPFRYKGGGIFPGQGGCFTVILPGSSCKILVEFAPTTTGIFSQVLKLMYHDGTEPKTISFTLIGGQTLDAKLVGLPSMVNIGSTVTSFNISSEIVIKNSGMTTATDISASAMSSPFRIIGGTCGISLAAGGICNYRVAYEPTVAGSHSSVLRINYKAGGAAKTAEVNVSGTASVQGNPALLVMNDASPFNYGPVYIGESPSKSMTVTNMGKSNATSVNPSALSSPFRFKGGYYPGSGGTCGSTIVSRASCTIVIEYSPTSTTTHSEQFNLNYSTGVGTSSISKSLTGSGLRPVAILSFISHSTVEFGQVSRGYSRTIIVTVKNTGRAPATSPDSDGVSLPFDIVDTSCPESSLAAGATCTFEAKFTPTNVGSRSAVFSVSYHDGSKTTATQLLFRGTGK